MGRGETQLQRPRDFEANRIIKAEKRSLGSYILARMLISHPQNKGREGCCYRFRKAYHRTIKAKRSEAFWFLHTNDGNQPNPTIAHNIQNSETRKTVSFIERDHHTFKNEPLQRISLPSSSWLQHLARLPRQRSPVLLCTVTYANSYRRDRSKIPR